MAQVKIPFDEKEAVRYFGAKKDDREAARLVDEAFIALRNEVQPRAVKRRLSCRVTPPCDGGMGRVELEGGTVFESNQLANHLLGCPEVILFGATLGSRFDIGIRRLSLQRIAYGAAAQAVGAALIESYCDKLEEEWKGELSAEFTYRSRFSPGYGDWPLTDQEKIFRLLELPKKIGLTLTAGGLMAPIKSVTAVIGINHGLQNETRKEPDARHSSCNACVALNCPFRKEEP